MCLSWKYYKINCVDNARYLKVVFQIFENMVFGLARIVLQFTDSIFQIQLVQMILRCSESRNEPITKEYYINSNK